MNDFSDEIQKELELEDRIQKKYGVLFEELYIAAVNGEYDIFPRGGYTKFIDDIRNLDKRFGEELEDNDLGAKPLNPFAIDSALSDQEDGVTLEDHAHRYLEILTMLKQAGVKYELTDASEDGDEEDEEL